MSIENLHPLFEPQDIAGIPEAWQDNLEAAIASFPGAKRLDFLCRDFILAANDTLLLPQDAVEALFRAVGLIRRDEKLARLAWLWREIFLKKAESMPYPTQWPSPIKAMGPDAALFSAVVLISMLPPALEFHRQRGVSEDISKASFRDFYIWLQDYYDKHGRWGLAGFTWLLLHLRGELYRLGRLQFCGAVFEEPVAEGFLPGLASIPQPGDPVLAVHIPADGKLDHEQCRASYLAALEFFPAYFPEIPFDAFTCHSWLLDPELRKILPESSNIVRFQRDFHIYSIQDDDRQMFERVFGNKPADLSQAPRDSSLRRAILDHLQAGNSMHKGMGFILRQEIEALKSAP
jgi:hypothetical protein